MRICSWQMVLVRYYRFLSSDPRTFLLLDILLAHFAEEHLGLLSSWEWLAGRDARASFGGPLRCRLGQADPVQRKTDVELV